MVVVVIGSIQIIQVEVPTESYESYGNTRTAPPPRGLHLTVEAVALMLTAAHVTDMVEVEKMNFGNRSLHRREQVLKRFEMALFKPAILPFAALSDHNTLPVARAIIKVPAKASLSSWWTIGHPIGYLFLLMEMLGPEIIGRNDGNRFGVEVLQTLTKFCFPFYVDSLTVSQVGQNFTFVLTDIDSKQRFGFCRLSSGAKSCFCILSYLPWFEVFYKLLNILADYTTKNQENQWNELLETLHKLPIPDPGVSVHLSMRNLTEYFVAVDVNNMLHLYASMLYERRILIVCSKLSTLTACIHGAAAMLYPMYWQHVYIPVLPPHLLDYCCAPMPYLIGIHLSLMEKVRNMALDDVVILNVDTNTLETPFDDLQSLPNDVISSLKSRLKKVSTTTGDGVARAFLKAQAAFFGSYRNALKIEPEEPITFCEEAFVSHYRSGAMRQFLQNATQLQLFKQFIDGRLDLLNSGEGFSDIFEEEINMGEYAGSDKLYHQWLSTVRDIAENGCAPTADEQLPKTVPSPMAGAKDPRLREDRRPITVHFGQVRPPRPHVVKRPKSNISVEGRRTSISSPEQNPVMLGASRHGGHKGHCDRHSEGRSSLPVEAPGPLHGTLAYHVIAVSVSHPAVSSRAGHEPTALTPTQTPTPAPCPDSSEMLPDGFWALKTEPSLKPDVEPEPRLENQERPASPQWAATAQENPGPLVSHFCVATQREGLPRSSPQEESLESEQRSEARSWAWASLLILAKPSRHYAVFLSEDSSDDEYQWEEGPSSGFTESFFFSAPFEWSLLPSSTS
ncbi:DENN domain-containing protein 1A [Tupaia chinensis]|uniref:DENN domain-containing protein 1A n=1 Tax=Tupaia chinensis TaxID=246437 RepID=L9JE15_TUPCH|nr:DENN domain-containing protein 1A [Tupaia chinensis]